MRFLSTKVHGVIDYVGGVALILAPMIFQFQDVGGMAVALPMILGVGLIIYSLCTRYELGLVKILPMMYHLIFDFIAAALLTVSPWLFGFYDANHPNQWLPHVVVGLGVILVVLVTKTQPADPALRSVENR